MQTIKVKNPILRGFNPDPNILRAKDRYYIIVSSFEWLPGIRVYESKNLVNWSHTTDILTTQVSLQGNPTNGSIWAPQISYADGLFYLVYTDVKSAGRPFKDVHNYLITASEITGPWSEPIYLNSNGFDPSLFHDLETGKKWLVNELWDYRLDTPNKSSGIVLQEYDAEKKKLDGPIYKIFAGTELAKTEAPHLYFRNGYYYLMTAEGGTGRGHSVTVCRAKKITGPYELDPGFPMLTASDKPASTLQCTGHGSLVQTPSGKWYMTYLCTRPLNGAAILGRETAIQEVYWTSDDWLRLKDNQTTPMEEIMIETNEEVQQERDHQFMDTFEGELKKNWNARRILPRADWCDTKTRPGFLRLIAGESLQSTFDHHLLAIRQTDFTFDAETAFEYTPNNFNQMAGLVLYLNESNYIYCYVTWDENKGKCLRMIESENGVAQIEDWRIPLTEKKTFLKVAVRKETAQFYLKDTPSEEWKEVGLQKNMCILSGGFTGNFIGIVVHDLNRKRGSYADFEFFKYEGKDLE
ncbi:glycoside hydrolase family 43 protein [Enterococcus faecium]|uniref:glycoside hydrolase family 43 protein n=1 Tax=Enterococcus TaxID=1350 RepID=UPI0008A4EF70|nr:MULTISPECIES: glycoside hydrolase family 43 protein [Enterococcus]EGP4759551.1 glycoside hydrolase family 43 protein [Enterococcus faecium]EGP4767113.1 glycoside hydrolase family 43 protein [Enterococcus faecium]EGP4863246.1 glycoside hydrolase family 43 protein [Enterococcus faecium]EGP4873966.1 glycoside hydrolase family 43 protein [Enterococcus faecium]EGP4983523.1 glycoside hydrolase family 43 protein [Enterococcus faecium]